MPLPTIPDPALAAAAADLRRMVAALDVELAALRFEATSADGKVVATADGEGNLVSLSLDAAWVRATAVGAIAAAVLPVANAALLRARNEGRARLAQLLPSLSLPGFPAAPPSWPDIPGFRSAVFAVRSEVIRHEGEGTTTWAGSAADGKVNAVANAVLELTALSLDATLPASTDVATLAAHVRDAINQALARGRHGVACFQAGQVPTFFERPAPAEDRGRALLVVGATPLSAADQALRDRLSRLGFVVDVRTAAAVTAGDADRSALVVVSESISAGDLGGKLAAVAVPVMVLEPAVLDDMRMTGARFGIDHGEALNQTEIEVADPAHPLAAGFMGRVLVAQVPSKLVWGAPAASARKVARIVGRADQWAIFAYERGSAMVAGTAPARRIGWFAGRDTPAAFTDSAWALFDAAVLWAVVPRVLLVVGATPLSASDEAIRRRIETTLRVGVDVRLAADPATSDASGMRAVVISESSFSGNVAGRFQAVPVPVIVMEPALFDDMRMTGPTWMADFGDAQDQTQVDIIDAAHPLAAGLTGRVAITSAPKKLVWGKPSASAAKVVGIVGRANAFAVFGYPAGADMVGLRAPAPRVGWFAGRDTAASLTPAGWSLFDAALTWAVQPRALLVVGQMPLRPADAALRARLEVTFGLAVDVKLAPDVRAADASGRRVVVISESSFSGDVGTRLVSVPVPMVVLEPALFDDLKMTGSTWMTDIGDATGQTQLEIMSSAHPLANGLSGRVSVTSSPQKFVWGKPAADAAKVAGIVGRSNAWGVFGYETGAAMAGLRAPARRVGWFAGRDTASALTPDGWKLFEAAVRWAAGPIDVCRECTGVSDSVFAPEG